MVCSGIAEYAAETNNNVIRGESMMIAKGRGVSGDARRWISINRRSFEVHVDTQDVRLTRTEFDLLTYLIRHAARVVPKQELIDNVVGGAHACDTSLVRVHIANLRRKLGGGNAIETVRGRGLRFRFDRGFCADIIDE